VTLRAGLAVGVGHRSCSGEAVSAVCVKGQAWRRVRLNNGWAESEACKCCVVRWMRNAGGRMGHGKGNGSTSHTGPGLHGATVQERLVEGQSPLGEASGLGAFVV
jgi:hypothetical protein